MEAVGDKLGLASVLDSLGKLHDMLADTASAKRYFESALPLRRSSGDRSGEAATLYGLASVARKEGRLDEARALLERAVEIIESLRSNIVSKKLRTTYFASVHRYFSMQIDLLMQMHRERPSSGFDGFALRVSESARARSLLEMLAEADSDIKSGVDPALVKRDREIQEELNAAAERQSRLLRASHSPEQATRGRVKDTANEPSVCGASSAGDFESFGDSARRPRRRHYSSGICTRE
jgi:tetratricopeptide (TPR) repeat protein